MAALYEVGRHDVVKLWPQVEALLAMAFDVTSPEFSLDQLKTMIVAGQQILLVAAGENGIVGAATISPVYYPNETVAVVTCLGGRMVSDHKTFSQLRAWCETKSFTLIRGYVRESVSRLYHRLGFKETARVIDFDLKE